MSKIQTSLCTDCPNPEPHLEATCPTHRINAIRANIDAQMQRPSSRALTSRELELRERGRLTMATTIKLGGGAVRPEYE